MANQWYYSRGSEGAAGPCSVEEIKELALSGEITPRTFIRRGEEGIWIPATKVKGIEFKSQQDVPPEVMANQWYYSRGFGEAVGPFSFEKMQQLAWDGAIPPSTFVRKGDEGEWIRAHKVKGFAFKPEWDMPSETEATPGGPPALKVIPSYARRLSSSTSNKTSDEAGAYVKVFAFCCAMAALVICSGVFLENRQGTSSSSQEAPISHQQSRSNWYSGGTLHGATLREWYAATSENRLATCADFLTTKDERLARDMDELKRLSVRLERAISTAGREAGPNETVASVCATLFVLRDQGYEL